MSDRRVRVTVRAVDRAIRRLARIYAAFALLGWWLDWRATYGNPAQALKIVESRWHE